MKHTAVEWLIEQLHLENSQMNKPLFEQAKAMENQEKIDFADEYGTYLLQGGMRSATSYQETFKSE